MPIHFEYRAYRAAFRHALATAHGVWSEREGILVRLDDNSGHSALGEIAPLPEWGSETLGEALAFCAALPSALDEAAIRGVPNALPCCRFALETAWESLHRPAAPSPVRQLAIAALLPAGPAAIEAAARATAHGHAAMKWKVGVGDAAAELDILQRLLAALPSGASLRIDANGAWDLPTARKWLSFCEGRAVEFIEQPFPVGHEQPILQLANEFSTPIALDESVARHDDLRRWLDFGWPGIYVVKPALAGSPQRLLKLFSDYEVEAVFSSAFETAIGVRAALGVAARAAGSGRALGFGTIGCFADERLNLPNPGPTLSTKWLARLAPGPLWEIFSNAPHTA